MQTEGKPGPGIPAIEPEKIKEVAADLADQAAEFIRKHPLESVGGALVAGLLLGLLINRK